MSRGTSREGVTLLDVLVDGFEKNEVLGGFYWRELPMPDEDAAVRRFASLVDEARRWKGRPDRLQEGDARRMAAWPDLEIRQAGRGLLLRVRAPRFAAWWHDPRTWADDPMGSVRSWTLGEPAST